MDRRLLPAVFAALLFAVPGSAHDGGAQKILDKQKTNLGCGYKRGAMLGHGGLQTAITNNANGFPSQNVTLLSWLTLPQLDGASGGNDCWGYVSPSGREYAIFDSTSSTVFVEITDPQNPVVIEVIGGPTSTWRDTKTYQNYAYSVSEGGSGIQVMDLSQIDSGTVTLVNVVDDLSASNTHNVAIDTDSGYLYRCGTGVGMAIYDLTNPVAPNFVALWNSDYVHDAQVVTYTSGPFAGKEIAYLCTGGGSNIGLDVLDVTNKSSLNHVGGVYFPTGAYSHQGWLTPDRQYFYLGDEIDEGNTVSLSTTYIIDVSDPYNPVDMGLFTNSTAASTHNLYTRGNQIFEANYTSGLRVFDATDPLNPVETGYFDTYAPNDNPGYSSLWSCYADFPSGVVIGSDRSSGLFVWDVGQPLLQIVLTAGPPALIDPLGDTVPVQIIETSPGDLVPGSAKLFYDYGQGFAEAPLNHLGADQYEAVFPALPCGVEVDWFVSAMAINNVTTSNPAQAPAVTHGSLAVPALNVAQTFDMEVPSGWTGGVAGDTATTGIWTRQDPNGTAANPEDDHTVAPGTLCWFTGQGTPSGPIGQNDVDGGTTTLLTPVLDLSTLQNPQIHYWRWFSNDEGSSPDDIFVVEISNDGGNTWHLVEEVGPTGEEASGGWFHHSFYVGTIVSPTNQVQLSFQASDLGAGSIVEAAIDDFEVIEVPCPDDCNNNSVPDGVDIATGTSMDVNNNGIPDECQDCCMQNYCQAEPNSTGFPALIAGGGSLVVADNNFHLTASQLPLNQNGYFLMSLQQDFIQNPGGSQGNLCLGGQIVRFANQVLNSDIFGAFALQVDLTNVPQVGAILAGETWNFTAWFRDLNPNPTSNFTDGIEVQFH